ncbi:hypothetical protein A3J20_06780 [Candidatus Gottesmanbacteria bacterium RIFCSPLOWO2_02_FULL_42_29]|uniref:Uncharacterized protein n=2 Tax=Candidatus Gottesmaniibacteriota TaxID=1752720 RepID=A0A1F6BCB6_9BACT|nr:MAG: hypothetical protein UV09_C0028G0006 [Candidatus Gottesmanbacteria bacterium GW2011_GWA2_42_18]KKS75526.1 MAG: hypothetical protein UV46_C0017G0014 [Candidatus Gottesmanbacteria bacterium GW2011_GWC2_42_8]OGG09473.1 MAG: hypothetical protein A2781_06700 [Candidatus Gottesmanbacteria bacterium RIFCSPHIGHO2_01_FULL_42_27]OGG19456.1 MAG: hypothetical protein A3E72_05870 [Candidatus Gottesmanbacteria bacterium RIFCSPHIGHO2_12_FULL_43_26]OGG34253.1 MAG: hypothetical protein A3G68_07500 [Cand
MKQTKIQSVGDILIKFNPLEDKFISREFQAYGYHLAETLNDIKHKSLYMKLAKNIPRPLLGKALTFCADAKVKSKGRLFMWKLKELGAWENKNTKKKTADSRKIPIKDIPF